MDNNDFISLVLYYGRINFYHTMQKVALDGLGKFPTQSAFRLFNGFALILGNRVQEGIRELNPLKNDVELRLAAILSLIYAHKHCSNIDKGTLLSLETLLKEENQKIDISNAAYYASVFYYFTGDIQKAHEMAEQSLKLNADHIFSRTMKCWTDLHLSENVSGNTLKDIELVLSRSNTIDAFLAQVDYYKKCEQYDNAISVLNKISVRFPELNIPLIEKMQTQLAAYNWDHAYETSLRIINLDPYNISALQVKCLILIIRDSNFKTSLDALHQLFFSIERIEVGNENLFLQNCQLFSRLCSRNIEILNFLIHCLERPTKQTNCNVKFITEMGFIKYLSGNVNEATECFQLALKLNGNSFYALCGMTLCQLYYKKCNTIKIVEQTRQQTEFLHEILGNQKEPIFLYIKALQTDSSDRAINLLVECVELHMKGLSRFTFGIEYIRKLNPDFMLQIVTQLLNYLPWDTRTKRSMQSIHITLKQSINVLETVIRSCPGHVKAIFLRAKVDFLCGEISIAALTLQRILSEVDPTCLDSYLLLAEIQIETKQYSKALQSLQMSLSHNFSIRDNPKYHLMLGVIQRHQQKYSEARKSFLTVFQIVNGKSEDNESSNGIYSTNEYSNSHFSTSDKITLYLELVSTLRDIGDQMTIAESERLLQTAIDEFSNSPEEGRILLAHVDILIKNFNVSKAISMLSAVNLDQPYYMQAKLHLANIYLTHKNDRVAFIKCFTDLVDILPNAETYIMLGEAYMTIQEPDFAIEAYKKALNMNPNDTSLASKLGRAYVKSHQYNNAIKYYKDILLNHEHLILKLDLAELYLKLKQYKIGADILTNKDVENSMTDIFSLQVRTKELLLLSRIYEKSGNIPLSLCTLREARNNQYRVQKRISVDKSSNLYEQCTVLSKISLLMAQQSMILKDNENALECLKECLKYTPKDIEVLTFLAKVHMQMDSIELCRENCITILQIDSNNETASVMMADLSFRKMEFANAAYHFSQLLISQPCYWTALARFIEIMRRSGTLSELKPFMERAEKSVRNSSTSAGLIYCKGLLEWYGGNPNIALRNFNSVRKDIEWGQQAIYNMIEICINPDGDIPNLNDIQENVDGYEFSESRLIALRTAERLLKELRPKQGTMLNEAFNYRLLQNFLKLSSRQKFQIEAALQDFTQIINDDKNANIVGPIYGMALAFVLLKQIQRAKNYLKRISRTAWNFEEAEYLERSWLLLGEIYINSNKLDVAETLVLRVLQHNQSCTKGYELLGYIAEKGQMHREASKHYRNAWIYGARSKPHVGYKLAYTYMKNKQYSNAINVCQQVIALYPDYIVIRKDILDKCKFNLRP